MAAIPVRLPPLPGEALDSWLEAYADLLHVTVRDIFAFAGRLGPRQRRPAHGQAVALPAGRAGPGRTQRRHRGPPGDAGRHDAGPLPGHRAGRGDRPARHAADPALVASAVRLPLLPSLPGRQRRPVDARLADPLGLRLHRCQVLLADTCPGLRPAAPAHPHRPAPPARPLRPHRPAAAATGARPAAAPSPAPATPPPRRPPRCRPAGTCWPPSSTSTPLSPRCSPHEAGPRKQPSCGSTWTTSTRSPALPPQPSTGRQPPRPRPPRSWKNSPRDQARDAASPLASPAGGPRLQLAPVTAFGAAIADIMLHGRRRPRPGNRRLARRQHRQPPQHTSPADILVDWDRASPALQAALARPLAARLDTFYQLRYRAVACPARVPGPARARSGPPSCRR